MTGFFILALYSPLKISLFCPGRKMQNFKWLGHRMKRKIVIAGISRKILFLPVTKNKTYE